MLFRRFAVLTSLSMALASPLSAQDGIPVLIEDDTPPGTDLSFSASEEKEPDTVLLIENVSHVDSDSSDGYPTINILIENERIKAITTDEVRIEKTTLIVNAAGGYLIGGLEMNSRPTFLILNSDPAQDINVLLDTKEHTKLAVSEGKIVKNRYSAKTETPEEAKRRTRGAWLAYTPPPLAAPQNYGDATKWNRWESKAVSGIFVGALVLDRMNWRNQNSDSKNQVGDLEDFSGGAIRGLRFGSVGALNFSKPWVYTIFAATNAFDKGFDQTTDDTLQIFDFRLDIPTWGNTTLSVGKQKEPISAQRLTSMIYISQQERAASIDAMLPARNTGAVLSGAAFDNRLAWAGGVFNSWLDVERSLKNSATQWVGRVSGVPLVSLDESNLLHMALGARYSNARNGIRYASEPEFNESPVFVDTDPGTNENGAFEAENSLLWNAEIAWRKGPVLLTSEYQINNVKSAQYQDPEFTGYYISGIWALTGEMRRYNYRGGIFDRPPVARTVYQSGWGAWELTARYSNVDLTDGGIEGGDMNIASAGVRWWLTPFMYIDTNYRYITLDRFGTTGYSNGFQTRIMLSLE